MTTTIGSPHPEVHAVAGRKAGPSRPGPCESVPAGGERIGEEGGIHPSG